MSIQYRKMNRGDYQAVKALIRQAWFDEYDFKDRVKNAYARAYLRIYLADSNYRMVACNDENEVIGFLLGKRRKVNFFVKHYHLFMLFWIQLGFIFTKPGRRKNKILRKTEEVNRRLLKKHEKYLFNELALFIIDEDYQGQGIGTKLERDFSDYLKANNEKYLYLFSDTYSNYEFYERRNYVRGGELVVDFDIEGEKEFPLPIYFIYYKEL